jgi:hypothetical protein
MSTIRRRLGKLEKILVPIVGEDIGWGSMATCRDLLLSRAQERGEPFVVELTNQLETIGPCGLWIEIARGYLGDRGFVQRPTESFAETICRALGIGSSALRIRIQEGRLGMDLVNKSTQSAVRT